MNPKLDLNFRMTFMLDQGRRFDSECMVSLDVLSIYRILVKTRKFEEKCVELAREGLFPTNPHLSIGQEATIVGVCSALRSGDYVTTTHRGHGHNIAMGADVDLLIAELLGRERGYLGGKGGTMHAASFERGVMGAYPVVGDAIHVATGLGLATSYLREDRVVACFFGDGAANAGAFHECINLAAVWRLPVVYVCENNLYAISTPIQKSTLVTEIARKACAYGVPGTTVDGMDVEEVFREATEAVERARRGEGPTLVECRTYRFRGSSEGEPGNPDKLKYRAKEELDAWLLRDPVLNLRSKIVKNKLATEEQLKQVEEEEAAKIEGAARSALASQTPSPR